MQSHARKIYFSCHYMQLHVHVISCIWELEAQLCSTRKHTVVVHQYWFWSNLIYFLCTGSNANPKQMKMNFFDTQVKTTKKLSLQSLTERERTSPGYKPEHQLLIHGTA